MGIAPELEVDKFLIYKIQEAMTETQTKLIFTGDKPTTLSIQVRQSTPALTHHEKKSTCPPIGKGARQSLDHDVQAFSAPFDGPHSIGESRGC